MSLLLHWSFKKISDGNHRLNAAFASFKGRFPTNIVRSVLGALNDPEHGIINVNSELPIDEFSAAAGRYANTEFTVL